jgi:hypothetical protein
MVSALNPRDEWHAWVLISLVGMLTLGWLGTAHVHIAEASLLAPMGGALALMLVAGFYRNVRPEPRLASTCTALAQLVLFTMLAGPLSYLAATFNRPLVDARLMQMDQALGFDWHAYLNLIDAHPGLAGYMKLAYETLMPQLAAAILILGLSGRYEALRVLVWSVMGAALVCIAVSAYLPAIGAYAHLGLHSTAYPHIAPSDDWAHVADFRALRDGTFHTLALDRMQGIIAFPSFHAALGVIFAWAYCQHPLTRFPGLAFEALMFASIPIDGAHYLADILIGSLVSLTVLELAKGLVRFPLNGEPQLQQAYRPVYQI